MARIKVCPCGERNPVKNMRCAKCRIQLTHVADIDVAEVHSEPDVQDVTGASPSPSAPDLRTSASMTSWTCPQCYLETNSATNALCLRCDSPRARQESTPEASFTLRFPFGHIVVAGQARIGRDDSWSPLAHHLRIFDRVSLRHAELTTRSGRLFLVDVGSSNGVFVNGEAVKSGIEIELMDGDRVAFSSQVAADVQIGRKDPAA